MVHLLTWWCPVPFGLMPTDLNNLTIFRNPRRSVREIPRPRRRPPAAMRPRPPRLPANRRPAAMAPPTSPGREDPTREDLPARALPAAMLMVLPPGQNR